MTEEKIMAIQKLLGSGLPDEEIKLELKEEGYSPEEITKTLFLARKISLRNRCIILGCVFLIIGIFCITVGYSFVILSPIWLFGKAYLADQDIKKANDERIKNSNAISTSHSLGDDQRP